MKERGRKVQLKQEKEKGQNAVWKDEGKKTVGSKGASGLIHDHKQDAWQPEEWLEDKISQCRASTW